MSDAYNELKILFVKSSAQAIVKCQDLITSVSGFKTYQEFYSYHLHNPLISTCHTACEHP